MEGRRTTLVDYWKGSPQVRFAILLDWKGRLPQETGPLERTGAAVLAWNHRFVDGILGIPMRLSEAGGLLADRRERRLLGRAFVHDEYLNPTRRRALLTLLMTTLLLFWGIAGLAIALVWPHVVAGYQAAVTLFFYSLATSVVLPTPFELLLDASIEQLGVTGAVLVAAGAKAIGSWLVLLAGDRANAGLERLVARSRVGRTLLHGLERVARRYGLVAVFVLFAIPFMSDTAPLFAFAVLQMRKLPFLAVTFAAIVVRSLLFIYGGEAITASL